MYHAIGKNIDKKPVLEHTVYISGRYTEAIFKWLSKDRRGAAGAQTKLVLSPVPTSTIETQTGRHPRTATWSVSEIVLKKKKQLQFKNWQEHQHEIDFGELDITVELAYHGLEIFKCISYDHAGSPRLVKDFVITQPTITREVAHIPLALVKMNTLAPPHIPFVVQTLHPYAGGVLEVSAWKRREAQLAAPLTPSKTTPPCSPAKKAKRSKSDSNSQPSISGFLSPQPSTSKTIVDIVQQQAEGSPMSNVPDDDAAMELILEIEEETEEEDTEGGGERKEAT